MAGRDLQAPWYPSLRAYLLGTEHQFITNTKKASAGNDPAQAGHLIRSASTGPKEHSDGLFSEGRIARAIERHIGVARLECFQLFFFLRCK